MNQRIPSFWGQYDQFNKKYLTADFSPRKYFRWQKSDTSLVLMDCPDLNSLQSFMNVDEYLLSQGLSAPEIIEADLENGFLLLEDFGDATFTKVLQQNLSKEYSIYQSAVDVLTHLQERTELKPPFLKEYTLEFGLSKARQFLTHYFPEVKGDLASSTVEDDFISSWKKALDIALKTKKCIFLRDYHVDNLMDLPLRNTPKNIGLLDFQDAIWAPVAGDLVSLLGDARREVSKELTNLMWKRFLDAHPKGDHEEIYIAGNILSAVRQVRILGLFTRASKERGDKRFLNRIPHLWNLFEKCCEIEELKPVRHWFDIHIKKEIRIIPNQN